tara:strand:+ start:203 stop:757 length:555 start_codon:yes stop_codon:yes gene_type:complete
MSDKNKNKDIFLQSIGDVQPLKRSNKKFKEVKLLKIENKKKERKPIKFKITPQPIKTKAINQPENVEIGLLSTNKKLKRGKIKIDKKIDFHGLSVDKARKIFVRTIDKCFYSNKRSILFITGKGMKKINHDSGDIKLFHGKIRENFQKWILEKEVSGKILNVSPAGFFYGGDGAFFVYLRKNKN